MSPPRSPSKPGSGHSDPDEAGAYLRSLEEHGRLVKATSEQVSLPAGVTHVLVSKPGAKPRLVEKRKSFF